VLVLVDVGMVVAVAVTAASSSHRGEVVRGTRQAPPHAALTITLQMYTEMLPQRITGGGFTSTQAAVTAAAPARAPTHAAIRHRVCAAAAAGCVAPAAATANGAVVGRVLPRRVRLGKRGTVCGAMESDAVFLLYAAVCGWQMQGGCCKGADLRVHAA
jgi:hypothetical protein